MPTKRALNVERMRLENQHLGKEDWRLWGPYLSERAWGTVREDYSADGNAWESFPHDHARSRVYRWNEDGLGGICDKDQHLCFALALWNEKDPYLKERAFGLTGNQGNRGEDVKEYYFYADATPSHSYLRYIYKYPQSRFPYEDLVEENARRGRNDPPYGLLDTGVFDESRYFDVEVNYAKKSPTEIHIRISATNHGPDAAPLHLLPTLWFRNTWSWGDGNQAPEIRSHAAPLGAAWLVRAEHPEFGRYDLYGHQPAEELFTDNETNEARLWGLPGTNPYVKDGFHDRVVAGDENAVRGDGHGTKFAAWHRHMIPSGQSIRVDLVLSAEPLSMPFRNTEVTFASREAEAGVFYYELLPDAQPEDHHIMREALAGMVWCKQYFNYDVRRWLGGDTVKPPQERWHGRNSKWKHFNAADVISMPDSWEYPWFAAWDLAFHAGALALIDVDFAKDQIELMLREDYLHPNGQLPAYEWNFSDVNPPVHALGALKVFRAERVQRGKGDRNFLQRVFHKLLLNYSWWINRKDADGQNIFEGGFLGLDNISVFDRSQPLPAGYTLKQADATGWMAMFALDMTVMALELAEGDPDYEPIAIQTYEQFMAIANSVRGNVEHAISLWDEDSGFFKDLIISPDGAIHRIDVYSMVGLIPLFATEVIDQRLIRNLPRFSEYLQMHKGGMFQGTYICACPDWENERGEHLLALVDHTMLPRILQRLLNEDEFLSRYGIRSVSRVHATQSHLGTLPGIGEAIIEYVPGESTSAMFGGNSNWRGPVWLPVNYLLIQAVEKFQRFLGNDFTVPVPCLGGRELHLGEIATLIAERVVDIYRRDAQGRRPAMEGRAPFERDPNWKDRILFYEYFHAETGQGLGASHQTGWTGLLANLVARRYRKNIPAYWSSKERQQAAE